MKVFKVTHRVGNVESLFLISANSSKEAKRAVQDDRELLGEMSAIEAQFETSYRLYSINLKTGEVIL